MRQISQLRKNVVKPGIVAGLSSALLFGAGTPLAKILLVNISPWLMAGLLYLGSGTGLAAYRLFRRGKSVGIPKEHWLWLAGAIFMGGVLGPGLQMLGLTRMPASGASLLLNAEGVFTALLAWFVFKENFDKRIALGMIAILAGVVILSWPKEISFAGLLPAICILGACLCWAIDNNLTRKISLADATLIACLKGIVAGSINLLFAFALGAHWPTLPHVAGSLILGFFAYGVSLVLFVVALRHLGTARTGAYFSIAPFFGAVIAVATLHEPVNQRLIVGGILMAIGLWLHLTEKHVHLHTHAAFDHDHEHTHDEHHQHEHPFPVLPGTTHSHPHHHEPATHTHEHYPDSHHQHEHE
jgi:drug/metabolite transporter (DMT)-like permease